MAARGEGGTVAVAFARATCYFKLHTGILPRYKTSMAPPVPHGRKHEFDMMSCRLPVTFRTPSTMT